MIPNDRDIYGDGHGFRHVVSRKPSTGSFYFIRLQDGRWVRVTEDVHASWIGEKEVQQ